LFVQEADEEKGKKMRKSLFCFLFYLNITTRGKEMNDDRKITTSNCSYLRYFKIITKYIA